MGRHTVMNCNFGLFNLHLFYTMSFKGVMSDVLMSLLSCFCLRCFIYSNFSVLYLIVFNVIINLLLFLWTSFERAYVCVSASISPFFAFMLVHLRVCVPLPWCAPESLFQNLSVTFKYHGASASGNDS